MCAFAKTFFSLEKRSVWIFRAEITLSRIFAEGSALSLAANSLNLTAGTSNVNVDSIQKRAGDFGNVTLNLGRRTMAFPARIAKKSTLAGFRGLPVTHAKGQETTLSTIP